MTSRVTPPDPFDVVAKALKCPKGTLSAKSAMYRDHGWDSFGHVSIIAAIEEVLKVSIENDEMLKLTTMTAICEFFDRQSRTNGE